MAHRFDHLPLLLHRSNLSLPCPYHEHLRPGACPLQTTHVHVSLHLLGLFGPPPSSSWRRYHGRLGLGFIVTGGDQPHDPRIGAPGRLFGCLHGSLRRLYGACPSGPQAAKCGRPRPGSFPAHRSTSAPSSTVSLSFRLFQVFVLCDIESESPHFRRHQDNNRYGIYMSNTMILMIQLLTLQISSMKRLTLN